ncbi:MAG: ABC transporter ATP-binding protein [Sandaracinaceae bacterium]|nr:ABC transporter ATP-binding protein [Sandaracinaceae bacterium]
MSERARVRFDGVSKAFDRVHVRPLLLRERRPEPPPSPERFFALRDVSFQIDEAESVAILGQNGSGKSTLLKLVCGATHPSRGRVSVRGRIAPLLSLGLGFELDLGAQENALINASLLGMPRAEAIARLPAILEFAELGEFVDAPVRHYSSGMTARLGFAVAMHVEADILLIDEVLAVGDGAFQQKCLERIRQLRSQQRTLLFVTHDLDTARVLCTRGLWIREGRVELDDAIDRCVDAYQAFLAKA